jgi:hypothetical protein
MAKASIPVYGKADPDLPSGVTGRITKTFRRSFKQSVMPHKAQRSLPLFSQIDESLFHNTNQQQLPRKN